MRALMTLADKMNQKQILLLEQTCTSYKEIMYMGQIFFFLFPEQLGVRLDRGRYLSRGPRSAEGSATCNVSILVPFLEKLMQFQGSGLGQSSVLALQFSNVQSARFCSASSS